MRFCSLGSGSRGNAYLIEYRDTTLLVDCGFSFSSLCARLEKRHVSYQEISAIVVSHEHNDHTVGLKGILKRLHVPCYMTALTAKCLYYPPGWCPLTFNRPVDIGDFRVHPVPAPHDAEEPANFIIEDGARRRIAILTDLGHVPEALKQACKYVHALVIEFNYDESLLQQSPYPARLRKRIAGKKGHLGNNKAAQLVAASHWQGRRYVVAAHLSENNNSESLVHRTMAAVCQKTRLIIATQTLGTDWLSI